VHKAEGTSVIRVIPVQVGQRRFLGVGAGATALLAELDDGTIDRILEATGPELGHYHDLSADIIRQTITGARSTGYAESRSHAYKSIYGLGMAVPKSGSPSEFAISIAVYAPDVEPKLIDAWKSVITEEIRGAARQRRASDTPSAERP
jgi:DNA-binding IclR family transcriptional regulator